MDDKKVTPATRSTTPTSKPSTVATSKSASGRVASPTTRSTTPTSNRSTVATSKSASGKVASPATRSTTPTSRYAVPADGQSSASKQTAAPTSKQTVAPTSKQTAAQASKQTAAPTSKQTVAPTSKQTAAPTSKQTAAPTSKQTVAQASKQTAAPTAKPDVKVAASVAQTKKTDKRSKSKTTAKRGARKSGGGVVSAIKENKAKSIAIAAVCFVLIIALVVGIVFGARSCRSGGHGGGVDGINKSDNVEILENTSVSDGKPISKDSEILVPPAGDTNSSFTVPNTSVGMVGYSAKVLGTVARQKPEVKNEGLEKYPEYGKMLTEVLGSESEKQAMRNALIAESEYLVATDPGKTDVKSSAYSIIDSQGYLWHLVNGQRIKSVDAKGDQRRLYKHSTADGMYFGSVSDSEPALKKSVTMRSRGYNGYGVTGLYAPAGELIKIEIDEKDMNATGGLTIHIGQALYNGQANNIWVEKDQMQRMPVILNTMKVNKNTATLSDGVYTAYVGSFVGGPIYIRNTDAQFTVTISGGVAYRHFILGHTTEEEFEKDSKSSAPYFDLEVWDRGVLHSGPKKYAENFSYDELYKAAALWEKVSTVTTTGSNQGIVFIYDTFVAAGAAVAFPGRRSVNCPLDWMHDSLNYNGIVTSGSWGNFHEYHHNFQGYGVGNGGEVTNNGMTLVSYALFTKISSNRGISNFGAQGLSGWNRYTSATWALEETLKIAREGENPENGNKGLSLYATLLHNFGADKYIQAKVAGGGENYTAYMKAWQNVTHNNMLYYFRDVLCGTDIDTSVVNNDYPMFVPMSCVYQTGRSYMYDGEKKYFQTMRPYIIPYGEPFDIDLSAYSAPGGQYAGGSIVIPSGFNYSLKSVTKPSNGSIEVSNGGTALRYTPDANNPSTTSGQIVLTFEVNKTDGAFAVDDIDIVLEFELSHEKNKMTLERTTYTFEADKMYSDAQTAFDSNYAGYTGKAIADHSNPTQNCNTDIWFYPNTEDYRRKNPNAPESYFVHDNTVEELAGKLYIQEKGKYRLYLRGRMNCALYYSTDGGATYKTGPFIKDRSAPSNSQYFRPNDPNTYVDLELDEDSWLYIKEVLIVQSTPVISYIGVGLRQWQAPSFTAVQKHYDADGNEVESVTSPGYHHSENIYYDGDGNKVSEEDVNNAEVIEPVVTNNSQPYVNAYRNSYDFPTNEDFDTDYFYSHAYNYNYKGDIVGGLTPSVVQDKTNYKPWDASFDINNLFDSNTSKGIHTDKDFYVGDDNPAIITVDLGKTIDASAIKLYLNTANENCKNAFPKSFGIEGSADGETFFEMGQWTNAAKPALSAEFTFAGGVKTFRYYRLTVTATHSHSQRVALGYVEFVSLFLRGNGANCVAPSNNAIVYSGKWEINPVHAIFGAAYLGNSGSKLSFEFIGTRLAVLTSKGYENNFDVYIDGKLCESVEVTDSNGDYGITYLSQRLSGGRHKVEIRCSGQASFDSFAIYDEDA